MPREKRFHKDAEKYLNKTDRTTFLRISEILDNLAEIPPVGDIVEIKGKKNTFRARMGKYRVIFRIEDDILYVRDIDSRGQVYKGGF
jgi:mRNA interferase RelE/StbE